MRYAVRMFRGSLVLLPLLCLQLHAVDFSHEIVPLLKKHCAECHAGDKKKGGFSFNTKADLLAGSENGPVIAAKDALKSRFLEVVLSSDPDEQMPPKGDRLNEAETALLKAWVSSGLPWEEGFAFKKPAYEPPLKPRTPALPAASSPDRTHPIDRILDAYLAKHQKAIPAPVEDATFARRAALDLTGLLPEVDKLQAFLADPSADKRTRFIEQLLADDIAYTEHWLTFWNDLLRNDYGGTGFITGGRKQVSKWLYESLVTNKPADQLTRELIAPAGDESRGFIDGIKWRGDVSAGQTVEIQFAQSVGQSFLGINMKCASCHDSFVDRWKLDEAYGLAAIYSTRPLDIARCDKPTGRIATASWLFPELGQVDPKAAQPERLKQLAALLTHPENGRFTRTLVNRLWHRLMGRGIVHLIPAGMEYDIAALAEPCSSVLASHLKSNTSLNETVVVIGAGPIGCLLVATAKVRGARAFIVVRSARRRELVERFAPDAIIDSSQEEMVARTRELTEGLGCDIAICANPDASTQEAAVRMVRKGGKVVLFGGLPKANPMTTLDSNRIHYGEIEVIGAFSYHPTAHAAALDLFARNVIPAERLITHRFSLTEIDAAYVAASSGEGLKIIVKPQE